MIAEIEANVFERTGQQIEIGVIKTDNTGLYQEITIRYTYAGKKGAISIEGELSRNRNLANFIARLISEDVLDRQNGRGLE